MKETSTGHCFRQHKKRAIIPAIVILELILSSAYLSAQFIVQPVNLAYLAQRADVIVQGRVAEVRHENLPGYPNIPTVVVTLEVDRMLRGSAAGRYTFREIHVGLQPKKGKQHYAVGQRLVLFLPAPSQYGLSSPIGMGQGRFRIAYDSGGSAMVANELDNALLFKDVERSAADAGVRLTTRQLRLTRVQRGPVALDDFVGLVKSLTALPRIR